MRRAGSFLLALAAVGCTSSAPRPEETPPPTPEPTPEPQEPVAAPPAPPPAPAKTNRQQRPGTIATSTGHVCALEGDGGVACWGKGMDGQLAPGVEENRAAPVRVPGISDAIALAVQERASCALRADRSLSCWGRFDVAGPTLQTTRALGDVVEFDVVGHLDLQLCARRSDGTVACGTWPELMKGDVFVLPGIDDAVGLEMLYGHGYVLRATGALDSFEVSKLGRPDFATKREEVGDVVDIGVLTSRLCASLASGEMRCHEQYEWRPQVPIAGPLWKAKIRGELWPTAIDYSAGFMISCLRDREGRVSCWGNNDFGQLGRGTPAYTTRPRRLFSGPSTALSAGGDASCAIREGGEIACYEQVGGEPPDVEGVRALAIGYLHWCAIVGGGEARCWGMSDSGATGAIDPPETLVRVPTLTDLAFIAVGDDHSCAARRDHTLRCWGAGGSGQLGDGRGPPVFDEDEDDPLEPDEGPERPLDSATPVPVEGVPGAIVGLALGEAFSCAATSVGVYCWGQLPNPSASESPIFPRPRPVLAGAVRAIDAEGASLCLIDGEGAVHCFGPVADRYRDGAAVKVSPGRDDNRPERFSRGGPLWKLTKMPLKPTAIAVGADHVCLLSETGEVSCWGGNEAGQLGDGTTTDREVPVVVSGLPGPAVQIAAGMNHSCARLAAGDVLCWGAHIAEREHGQSNTPAPVPGLAPYKPADPPAPAATDGPAKATAPAQP